MTKANNITKEVNGEKITFYPNSHRYKKDGEWLPSVTTIVNQLSKGDFLSLWYGKKTQEKMYEKVKDFFGGKVMPPHIAIRDFLKKLKDGEDYKAGNEERDKAAKLGTLAHELIEEYIKLKIEQQNYDDESVCTPEQFVENVRENEEDSVIESFNSFLNWEKEYEPHYESTEQLTYGETLGCKYAGLIDIIATIDGKRFIIDIKTSKDIYDSHKIQVAGYALAEDIHNVMIVNVPREIDQKSERGGYRVWQLRSAGIYERNLFIKYRNTFINLLSIKKDLDAAKKDEIELQTPF